MTLKAMILFAILSCFAVCFQQAESKKAESAWKKIDNFLKERVPDNGEASMAKAMEWLEYSEKPCWIPIGKAKREILERLRELREIKLIVDQKRCDKNSIDTFRVFQRELLNYKEYYMRLYEIEKVYSKRSAQACQMYYANVFTRIRQSPNPMLDEASTRILPFLTDLIHLHVTREERKYFIFGSTDYAEYRKWAEEESYRENLYYRFMIKTRPYFEYEEDAELAYDAIEHVFKNIDKSDKKILGIFLANTKIVKGRLIIHENQAKKLFRKLILDSCEIYNQVYGPKVFELADWGKYRLADENDLGFLRDQWLSDYYWAWAQYRVCNILLTNETVRSKLMDELGKVAEKTATMRESGQKRMFDLSASNVISGMRISEFLGLNQADLADVLQESNIESQKREYAKTEVDNNAKEGENGKLAEDAKEVEGIGEFDANLNKDHSDGDDGVKETHKVEGAEVNVQS